MNHFSRLKTRIYLLLLNHARRWLLNHVDRSHSQELYTAISWQKLLSDDAKKVLIGVHEAILSNNEYAKRQMARLYVAGAYETSIDDYIEKKIASQYTSQCQASQCTAQSPHLSTTASDLDILVAEAKSRLAFVWRFYAMLALLLTAIMVVMLFLGIWISIGQGSRTLGVALGGTGVGQFLLLIWTPLKKLDLATTKSVQVNVLLLELHERLKDHANTSQTQQKDSDIESICRSIIRCLKNDIDRAKG